MRLDPLRETLVAVVQEYIQFMDNEHKYLNKDKHAEYKRLSKALVDAEEAYYGYDGSPSTVDEPCADMRVYYYVDYGIPFSEDSRPLD